MYPFPRVIKLNLYLAGWCPIDRKATVAFTVSRLSGKFLSILNTFTSWVKSLAGLWLSLEHCLDFTYCKPYRIFLDERPFGPN